MRDKNHTFDYDKVNEAYEKMVFLRNAFEHPAKMNSIKIMSNSPASVGNVSYTIAKDFGFKFSESSSSKLCTKLKKMGFAENILEKGRSLYRIDMDAIESLKDKIEALTPKRRRSALR